MGRVRIALACVLVVAGTGAATYSLLSYRFGAVRSGVLTTRVERALDGSGGHVASGERRGQRGIPRPARPVLEVPAPTEGQALGIIAIPSIGLHTAFFEGVTDATLMSGPGHLPWTAAPGVGGVSVISAHRDLHFSHLKDINFGDAVQLALPWATQRYRVDDLRVLDPDDAWIAAQTKGTRIRLLTCWPPQYVGPAPQRMVVTASLVHSRLTAPPVERLAVPPGADEGGTLALASPVRTVVLPSAPGELGLQLPSLIGATAAGLAAAAGVAGARAGGRRRGSYYAFLAGAGALLVTLASGFVS